VVVDALRFDMCEWQHGLATNLTPPYVNKLPVIRDLLRDHPRRARLYRFVADAPTTTMQRIKGLATGGLPTFVDAGANFATEAIEEDNFLSQHGAAGRSTTFIGDDTWVRAAAVCRVVVFTREHLLCAPHLSRTYTAAATTTTTTTTAAAAATTTTAAAAATTTTTTHHSSPIAHVHLQHLLVHAITTHPAARLGFFHTLSHARFHFLLSTYEISTLSTTESIALLDPKWQGQSGGY
jgi:hypothetical protein